MGRSVVSSIPDEELQQELAWLKQMMGRGVGGRKYARQTARRYHDLRKENMRRKRSM